MIKDFLKSLMFWKYRTFMLEISDGESLKVYGIMTDEQWKKFKQYQGFAHDLTHPSSGDTTHA